MKKKALTAALAAAFVLTTAGSVFAAPIEFDGKFEHQYRYNTWDNVKDADDNLVPHNEDGFKSTVILNATTNIGKNVDFFARFAAQHATIGKDFSDDATSSENTAAIDQFGFTFKDSNGFSYKLGRQDASIGATAILYNTSPYLGKYEFADGVTVTGKSGVTDLKVIALKEDRKESLDENKLFALSASYSPAQNWTLGGTLAKYDYKKASEKDTNHWAVNAGYDQGKASYFAEYAKSNADNNNSAYGLGVSYSPDAKNTFYAINYKIEENADMNGWTDYESGWQGMYYGYNYKYNKDTTVKFFLRDMEGVKDSSEKNTSFRTTVSVKF